jgi:hypothetical protein
VDDAGDDMPPQPKKDPSLDPPGDFGGTFCTGVESDKAGLDMLIVCGGAAFVENTDIVVVEETEWLVELEPLYQELVDSVTVVRVDSLVNRACLVPGAREVWFCHGIGRVLFLGVLWSMAVTGSGDETLGVAALCSTEGLL